jgi:hypothetical protein
VVQTEIDVFYLQARLQGDRHEKSYEPKCHQNESGNKKYAPVEKALTGSVVLEKGEGGGRLNSAGVMTPPQAIIICNMLI